MKKKVITFLIAAFVEAVIWSILTILIGNVSIILFGISVITSMIIVKVIFPEDYKYYLLYPLSLIILYIPFNITSGMYIRNFEIRFYSSFPRPELILYFIGVIVMLYWITTIINMIMKCKATKELFIVADLLSLVIIYYTLMLTFFVSPH